MRGCLLVAVLVVAAGCSSRSERSRATSTRDAGALREDAAAVAEDAATSGDAGTDDARAPDAMVDAGFLDASVGVDAGDMCLDGPRKPAPPPRLHVINGTRQPTLVPLDPEQVMAIVALASPTGGAWCSGTLIADCVVLTATHCTEDETASSMRVLFGQDDLNPDLSVPVASKLEHPTRDIALLTLGFDPATQIAVRPIPIYLGTLTAADEGRTVEQAGYGDTESAAHGRFFVTEVLDAVDANTFTVDGMGQQGVCYGDSGGPSMLVAPEGDVRVIGELSEGDTQCAQRDDYVRVDVLRSWIETVTGPTPAAGPVACGMVTSEGRCDEATVATYCDNGALARTTCGTGEVCGWSGAGWRCVAQATDPCQGLGHAGTCTGQLARWCDRGTIHQRDCAACGETCLFLGDRIGYDCHVDPLYCGELDYLGRCDGDVAEWCNQDGTRERRDCTATGDVCRYIDSETGWYCDNP